MHLADVQSCCKKVQQAGKDLDRDESDYEKHLELLQSCAQTLKRSHADQKCRQREVLRAGLDCSGSAILTPAVCFKGLIQHPLPRQSHPGAPPEQSLCYSSVQSLCLYSV